MNLNRDYCNAKSATTGNAGRRPRFSRGTFRVFAMLAVAITAVSAFPAARGEERVDSAKLTKSSANQGFAINNDKVGSPGEELRGFAEMLDSTYRDGNLLNVKVSGTASPDGPYLNNKRLAEGRAASVSNYLQEAGNVPADYFTISVIPEDWEKMMTILPEYVSESEVAQVEYIIATYSDLDRRERFLRSVNGGRTWRKIVNTVLPRLRNVYLEAEVLPPPPAPKSEPIMEEVAQEELVGQLAENQEIESGGNFRNSGTRGNYLFASAPLLVS